MEQLCQKDKEWLQQGKIGAQFHGTAGIFELVISRKYRKISE